jgi:hypothetical protein
MRIATADLAAQTSETLTALLDTERRSARRHNLVVDLLAERGAIETPAAYTDLMRDDIITFGSRETEWVVLEREGRTLQARQIKGDQIGQTVMLYDASTRVWRVL